MKILNSLPNAVLISAAKQGFKTVLEPVSKDYVRFKLIEGAESYIGHSDFAEIISRQLNFQVEANRRQYTPSIESIILALVSPDRRLNEGEKWTIEEILDMPIEYFKCTFKM